MFCNSCQFSLRSNTCTVCIIACRHLVSQYSCVLVVILLRAARFLLRFSCSDFASIVFAFHVFCLAVIVGVTPSRKEKKVSSIYSEWNGQYLHMTCGHSSSVRFSHTLLSFRLPSLCEIMIRSVLVHVFYLCFITGTISLMSIWCSSLVLCLIKCRKESM